MQEWSDPMTLRTGCRCRSANVSHSDITARKKRSGPDSGQLIRRWQDPETETQCALRPTAIKATRTSHRYQTETFQLQTSMHRHKPPIPSSFSAVERDQPLFRRCWRLATRATSWSQHRATQTGTGAGRGGGRCRLRGTHDRGRRSDQPLG